MMDRSRSRTAATSKTEHFVITVDIDILIPPRDGDRKIMKSIRIWRIRKWNKLSQFR